MKKESGKEIIRFIKFTFFSISAGVIQMGSFALLNELLGWNYWVCYLIALVLSVVWNFTFNRKFTFKSASNVPVAMAKTLAFYAVFTPLTVYLEYFLTEKLFWNEYIATVINMLLNFITEFLYQRYFVFKDSIDTISKTKTVEND